MVRTCAGITGSHKVWCGDMPEVPPAFLGRCKQTCEQLYCYWDNSVLYLKIVISPWFQIKSRGRACLQAFYQSRANQNFIQRDFFACENIEKGTHGKVFPFIYTPGILLLCFSQHGDYLVWGLYGTTHWQWISYCLIWMELCIYTHTLLTRLYLLFLSPSPFSNTKAIAFIELCCSRTDP